MTQYAYLFEAKGIQSFIGESGRLVDLVGGSDLIAEIAASKEKDDDLLGRVLRATGLDGLRHSRRAGAAFCLHGTDKAALQRFRAAWRLAFAMARPGLAFVDVLVGPCETEIEALKTAYKSQSGIRENATATLLPLGTPITRLDARTGRPAVAQDLHNSADGTDRTLDRITQMTRERGRAVSVAEAQDKLSKRLIPDARGEEAFIFPRHFDIADADTFNPAFPFPSDDRRVGVVHADVSGLGQLFRSVIAQAQDAKAVRSVAEKVELSIEEAAAAAMEEVLDASLHDDGSDEGRRFYERHFGTRANSAPPKALHKVVPARPILLGGDDLTIILRADLAVGFAQRFLEALEKTTRVHLGEELAPFGGYLTACAGVAIVASGRPFADASHLAETLCLFGKKIVKKARPEAHIGPPASGLSFAVVTSSVGEDYEDFREREQMLGPDQPLTAIPYITGTAPGGPQLSASVELARQIDSVGGRSKLFDTMRMTGGERAYERFLRVLRIDAPDLYKSFLNALAECHQSTSVVSRISSSEIEAAEPVVVPWNQAAPFIADALELLDIGAVRGEMFK